MPARISDYPDFKVKVECLEEIFAQKLRALVQRKKVRDYYDVWRIAQQHLDPAEVTRLFIKKLNAKEVQWHGIEDIFPPELQTVLAGYCEKELGRLVYPVPQMENIVRQLKAAPSRLKISKLRRPSPAASEQSTRC